MMGDVRTYGAGGRYGECLCVCVCCSIDVVHTRCACCVIGECSLVCLAHLQRIITYTYWFGRTLLGNGLGNGRVPYDRRHSFAYKYEAYVLSCDFAYANLIYDGHLARNGIAMHNCICWVWRYGMVRIRVFSIVYYNMYHRLIKLFRLYSLLIVDQYLSRGVLLQLDGSINGYHDMVRFSQVYRVNDSQERAEILTGVKWRISLYPRIIRNFLIHLVFPKVQSQMLICDNAGIYRSISSLPTLAEQFFRFHNIDVIVSAKAGVVMVSSSFRIM